MSARDFDDDSAGGGFETTGTRGGNSSELGETTNGAANRGAGSRPNSAANAAAENVSSNLSGRKRARGERENHHSAPDRRSDRSDPGVAPGSPDSRAARAEGDSDVGTSGESGDESRSSSESRGGGDRERGDGGGSIPGRRGRRGGPGATGAGATGSRGATGSLEGSLGGGSIAEGKDSEPRRRGRRTPLGGGGERERGMISLKEDSASGSDEAAGGAPGAGANDGEEGGPRSGRAGRRRGGRPATPGPGAGGGEKGASSSMKTLLGSSKAKARADVGTSATPPASRAGSEGTCSEGDEGSKEDPKGRFRSPRAARANEEALTIPDDADSGDSGDSPRTRRTPGGERTEGRARHRDRVRSARLPLETNSGVADGSQNNDAHDSAHDLRETAGTHAR